MSAATRIEHEHYQKLVGRQILAIYWDELEGQALPVLVLSGRDLNGHAATAAVLADPEGNAPGHLDHHL
jgi:hypothetical protein